MIGLLRMEFKNWLGSLQELRNRAGNTTPLLWESDTLCLKAIAHAFSSVSFRSDMRKARTRKRTGHPEEVRPYFEQETNRVLRKAEI